MRCLLLILTLTLTASLVLPLYADEPVVSTDTETVLVPKSTPILFPVLYKVRWSDTFGAPRDGGRRKHQGQDLMAPKMTPLVAVFDGRVYLGPGGPGGHYTISVTSDTGWTANYYHVNNDTPGTDDGLGGDEYAFAPGLKSGDSVKAGQLLGWVGDSGNAENTGPHCHFELWFNGTCVNAADSLRNARHLDSPIFTTAAPELKPEKGEMRLDGVVRSVQGEVMTLYLLAATPYKGKSTVIQKPERRYVLLKEAKLHRRDDPTQTLSAADLQPGLPVTVLGKDRGKGKALLARLTAPEIPVESPVVIASRQNSTLPDMTETPAALSQAIPAPAASAPMEDTEPAPEVARAPRAAIAEPDVDTRDVLRRVNEIRKQNSLSELTLDPQLSKAAHRHSKDMAVGGFCEHLGSDGSSVSIRVQDSGYSASRVAQNIAAGYDQPEKVVHAWVTRSRETHRNLLDPAFRAVGVGWYRASRSGQRCWTLVLASPQ